MKLKEKFLILVLTVLTAFVINACVQATESINLPTVTILTPKSNDTIYVGKYPIVYDAKDYYGGPGLRNIDLIINDEYDKAISYQIKAEDITNPKIYLELDQGKIGSKIAKIKLIAYNKEGGSAGSNEVTNLYIRENTNPPAAPDSLKIERFSRSEIFLTWKDNSVNETKFQVWRKDGADGTSRILNEISAESKSFTDQFLSPFVIYYYKVRAINKYGESLFTNEVNSSEAPGNEPFDLTAEAVGASAVVLKWKNMLYVAEAIRVERKHATGTLWETDFASLSPTTEEYIDRQRLTPATTYKYRVGALIFGKWVYSNEVMVKTYLFDVNPPQNLNAQFISSTNTVKLNWGAYPPNATGTKIERRKSDSQFFNEIAFVNKDTTNFTDASVVEETKYYYRIRYSTSAGFNSFPTDEVVINTPIFKPIAPSNLTITKFGSDYFLEWKINSTKEDGFMVFIREANNPTFSYHSSLPAGSKNVTLTNIAANKTHYFAIKAFKGILQSDFSNEVSTDGAGNFTLTCTLTAKNPKTVLLKWTKPASNVQAYQVERKSRYGVWEKIGSRLSPSTESIEDTPPVFDIYTYRIIAIFASTDLTSAEVSILYQ